MQLKVNYINMKVRKFYLPLLIAVFVSKASTDYVSPIGDGHCIWYDTCDVNPEKPTMYLNCAYNGTAKPLTDQSSINTLLDTCPELEEEITAENGTVYTCCSPKNINLMAQQLIVLKSVLERCPSCLSNMRQSFCFFACHPRHSNFLMPTAIHNNETTGKESIFAVDEFIHETYVNDTYASCENVYYPPLNGPAMQLLCGPWGADKCTPQRLFNYFGNNEFAPFNITYVYLTNSTTVFNELDNSTSTYDPFNPEVIPCNTNDSSMHCLCSDCSQSCPPPPEPDPPKEYNTVGDLRLYVFILIIIFSVYCLVILVISIIFGVPGTSEGTPGFWTCRQKLSADIEHFLQKMFEKLAKFVASNPVWVLICSLLFIAFFSYGITNLEMTTDPVELWASPKSQTRKDKAYFDEHFGPFYRTNQVIITTKGNITGFNLTVADKDTGVSFDYNFGPVFDSQFMLDVLDLQLQIMKLNATLLGNTVTLNNICIKPLAPTNDECMIQSVMNYWQNDKETMMSMMTEDDPYQYAEFFLQCASNPTYFDAEGSCMATYGGPVFPYVALGGFLKENQTLNDSPHYEQSTALILTFLVENYIYDDLLQPALAWEKVFLDFMKNYSHPSMDIAFNAERGIEDEITREGKSDVSTILISYLVMFTYVTLALGGLNFNDCGRFWVETKITMGLSCVIIVFLSFVAASGFCGMIGLKSTLFVIEVVPFLVLAVGVDNIFLLVQTWRRIERLPNESIEDHVARGVGKIAPSMLLATTAETICFFLGALSQMPAVYSFSIFAGVALAFDFLLQITCLVSLITLDAKRIKENRYDVLCCMEGPTATTKDDEQDCCYNFFESVYTPFLMNNYVRVFVLLLFPAVFITACIYAPRVDVGLEQDIGMPDDSFVLKYFDFLGEYLSVGPPVYFVVTEGFYYPDYFTQNLMCSGSGCNDDSALTQIFVSSLSPDVSYLATGASSWLDSYFAYISDSGQGSPPFACCRLDANGEFIDTSGQYETSAVTTCLTSDQLINDTNRPQPQYFMENLQYFLKDNPHGNYCPQAGHPAYGDAVNIISTELSGWNSTAVGADNYMAYHSILKTSDDFTNAVDKAYNISNRITTYLKDSLKNEYGDEASLNFRVFPYSIFYVYYEQYLSLWSIFGKSIGVSLVAVFIVGIVLTGFDLVATCINVAVIIMIVVDIMAVMVAWNIQLNAISLVNLVMAIGISVEFCSHITHAFAVTPSGSRKERASKALAYTGSSVFSGITITKFGGIIVLAFANSSVIVIYYFRMFLLIVIFGATHGLIFIPVVLSVMGPSVNPFMAKDKRANKQDKRKAAAESHQLQNNGQVVAMYTTAAVEKNHLKQNHADQNTDITSESSGEGNSAVVVLPEGKETDAENTDLIIDKLFSDDITKENSEPWSSHSNEAFEHNERL